MEVAQQIAARNPEAIQGIKRLYNELADRHLPETLMLESEIQDEIIGGPNQIEAVMAEMEKREADLTTWLRRLESNQAPAQVKSQ